MYFTQIHLRLIMDLELSLMRRLENVFFVFAEQIRIIAEMTEDLFASYFICSK